MINPPFFFGVAAGQTVTFEADVTGSEDAEAGVHHLPFTVYQLRPAFRATLRRARLRARRADRMLRAHQARAHDHEHERRRRPGPRAAFGFPDSNGRTALPSRGVWTFGRLMRDMAPTPDDAPALTEQMLQTWLSDQTVNSFTIPARPAIQNTLIDQFPRLPDGSLDLDRSPLRLLAIVNRLDLRNLEQGNAGEGRFVFGVIGPFGGQLEFTVILEYKLPATTTRTCRTGPTSGTGCRRMPFPSEEYNAALEAITMRFSGRGAAPGRVNGSALSQLRTNEIALSFRWELREFALVAGDAGSSSPTTVKLTPDLGFNGSPTLADFVTQNEASIVAEKHNVPETFQGGPFLAGSVFNDLIVWQSPSINFSKSEARFQLSKNTCNGCHGPETNTTFLQIFPKRRSRIAALAVPHGNDRVRSLHRSAAPDQRSGASQGRPEGPRMRSGANRWTDSVAAKRNLTRGLKSSSNIVSTTFGDHRL